MNDSTMAFSPAPTLRAFALEMFRMEAAAVAFAGMPQAVSLRHSLRKLRAALDACGVTQLDLTGRPCDPGLAVDVADIEGEGEPVRYSRMLAPIVMWNGQLLSRGEAVVQAEPPPTVQIVGERKRMRASWQVAISNKRKRKPSARARGRSFVSTSGDANERVPRCSEF